MAVVGLLEHLCSLMDTQPSEVTPLFFEFRIEFLPDGWKKVENSFLPRKIWKKVENLFLPRKIWKKVEYNRH